MMMMIRETEEGVKERADFLRQPSQQKSVEQNVFFLFILKSIFGAQANIFSWILMFFHIRSFGFKQVASPSF